MKVLIEVDVTRVEGKNLSAATVGEHIIRQLIERGELDGYVWPDGHKYKINGAQVAPQARETRPPRAE